MVLELQENSNITHQPYTLTITSNVKYTLAEHGSVTMHRCSCQQLGGRLPQPKPDPVPAVATWTYHSKIRGHPKNKTGQLQTVNDTVALCRDRQTGWVTSLKVSA